MNIKMKYPKPQRIHSLNVCTANCNVAIHSSDNVSVNLCQLTFLYAVILILELSSGSWYLAGCPPWCHIIEASVSSSSLRLCLRYDRYTSHNVHSTMSTNIPHITRKITGREETKVIQIILYARNFLFFFLDNCSG
jgi:hypothetical protein